MWIIVWLFCHWNVVFDDGVLILYGCTSKTQKVCVCVILQHAFHDGRLEEVVLRHLDAEDGQTVIAKDIRYCWCLPITQVSFLFQSLLNFNSAVLCLV